ncbi:MAG: S41 family peptidase [Lachnospiraceae bacterium]|nr:S41 family peptidase [Lachnospiraceae bacterium]
MEIKIRKSLFILSIIGAFILGVCLTGAYTMIQGSPSASQPGTQSGEKISGDDKLTILKSYVDKYYLYDYDEQEMTEGAYKGYISGLDDPYSSYMDAEEYQSFLASATGTYSGVGITFSEDDKGNFVVMQINPGSPAADTDIKEGDFLLTVDGKEYSDVELMAAAIRGDENTEVTIEYYNGEEIKKVTMVRKEIVLQSVEYEMLEGNVGYIHITSFLNNTGEDFDKALKAVTKKGAKGLVLDLRGNGGGLVDESVEVADEFLDKGVVCYTEDKYGKTDSYDAEDGKTNIKTVVLIDGGSASASEILAAALRDNGFEIVGEKSYGKGVIQTTIELEDGSALKLTIMQYLSPNKKVINKKGVKPDYKVKDNENTETDEQLNKALEVLEH